VPDRLPVVLPRPDALVRLARRLPGGPAGRALARVAEEAGATPRSILLPDDPRLAAVVLHEPLPPEGTAALLAALNHRFAGPSSSVLCLTPRAWQIWSRGTRGRRLAGSEVAWGDPPPLPGPEEAEAVRRRALREASTSAWSAVPEALDARDDRALAAATTAARDRLERATSPVGFPPIPAADAPRDVRCAAHLGVLHAAFGAQIASDPGPTFDGRAERPPRSLAPLLAALAGPLADFVPEVGPRVDALVLLPGPLGTRLRWQLCAVVPDDAPLLGAARLGARLRQHLQLGGAMAMATGPVVLTRAALCGMLRLRLFEHPLRRLAIRLGAHVLRGDDVLADGLSGVEHAGEDLFIDAACQLEATAACWSPGAAASRAQDLLLGAWPALAWIARGGDPGASMATIHADLAGSADPARARVGSAAGKLRWGEPSAVDRARPTEFLRAWGPTLVRMQDVCLEALP
jgi:hypothetical protein